MAMRQRVTGYSSPRPRQTNRPIYEDFQPTSETKDEEGAQIVTLRLPGFLKEQIKLTAVHYPRIIRIQGERPLGNNKWSRFNQTFPTPPNCDVNKVHSKFTDGVLTVFLPKAEITTKTSQPAAEKSKTTERTPSTSKASDGKAWSSPPKTVADSDQKIIDHPLKNVVDDQQKEQKGQQKRDIIETSSKKTDEKAKDQNNKDQNETKVDKEDRGNIYLQEKERMKKKDKESSTADISTVPNKVIKKEKEKEKEKEKKLGTTTKEKQIKELLETSIKKGEGEKDEERQTLINIGAAVLVLVSFGAYVSYSLFGSFGKTKHA